MVTLQELSYTIEANTKGLAAALPDISRLADELTNLHKSVANLGTAFETQAKQAQQAAAKTASAQMKGSKVSATALSKQKLAVEQAFVKVQKLNESLKNSGVSKIVIASNTKAYQDLEKAVRAGGLSADEFTRKHTNLNAQLLRSQRTLVGNAVAHNGASKAMKATEMNASRMATSISRAKIRVDDLVSSIKGFKGQEKNVQTVQRAFATYQKELRAAGTNTAKISAANNRFNESFAGVKRSVEGARKGLTGMNKVTQDLSKSIQIALGPLSGVAARVTAFSGLVNRNTVAIAAMISSIILFSVVMIKAIKVGIEWETALLRLEAVLKATGFQAGITAGGIAQIAKEVGKATLTSQEAALAAAVTLASIENVNKRIFKSALLAAQGLAKIGRGDINSQMRRLARVLEDPASNLKSLSESGVFFNAVLERQIKLVQASGDIFGAQELVIKKLQPIIAAATGEAQGFAGAWDTLKETLRGLSQVATLNSGTIKVLTGIIKNLDKELVKLNHDQEFAIKIGRLYKTIVQGLADGFKFLVVNAKEISETLTFLALFVLGRFLFGAIVKTMELIGRFIKLLRGAAVSSIGAWIVRIVASTAAIGILGTSLVVLIGVLATAGVVLLTWPQILDEITDAMHRMGKGAKVLGANIAKDLGSVKIFGGKALTTAGEGLSKRFGPIIKDIEDFIVLLLNNAGSALSKRFGLIVESIGAFGDLLVTNVAASFKKRLMIFGETFDDVFGQGALDSSVDALTGWGEAIKAIFADVFSEKALNVIMQWFDDVQTRIDIFFAAMTAIQRVLATGSLTLPGADTVVPPKTEKILEEQLQSMIRSLMKFREDAAKAIGDDFAVGDVQAATDAIVEAINEAIIDLEAGDTVANLQNNVRRLFEGLSSKGTGKIELNLDDLLKQIETGDIQGALARLEAMAKRINSVFGEALGSFASQAQRRAASTILEARDNLIKFVAAEEMATKKTEALVDALVHLPAVMKIAADAGFEGFGTDPEKLKQLLLFLDKARASPLRSFVQDLKDSASLSGVQADILTKQGRTRKEAILAEATLQALMSAGIVKTRQLTKDGEKNLELSLLQGRSLEITAIEQGVLNDLLAKEETLHKTNLQSANDSLRAAQIELDTIGMSTFMRGKQLAILKAELANRGEQSKLDQDTLKANIALLVVKAKIQVANKKLAITDLNTLLERELELLSGGALIRKNTVALLKLEIELTRILQGIDGRDLLIQDAKNALIEKQTNQLKRQHELLVKDFASEIKMQQKRHTLLGASSDLRELELAVYQRELDLIKQFGPALNEVAEAQLVMFRQWKLQEILLANIEDDVESLRDAFVDGFEDIGNAMIDAIFDGEQGFKDLRDTAIDALNDIAKEMLQITLIQPLKNQLFGTAEGGGLLGDFGNKMMRELAGDTGLPKDLVDIPLSDDAFMLAATGLTAAAETLLTAAGGLSTVTTQLTTGMAALQGATTNMIQTDLIFSQAVTGFTIASNTMLAAAEALLTSSGSGGDAGLPGFLSDIINIPIPGSGLPPLTGPHREHGGNAAANQALIVGESGREVFVPKTSGTIIPNDQISVGEGGGTTVNNFNFNIETSDADSFRAAQNDILSDAIIAADRARQRTR